MALGMWEELVSKFVEGMTEALEKLKIRDVENIPGAKDQLVRRFEELIRYLPKEDGKLLVKSIDQSIQNTFFPRTDDLAEAFSLILKARTHDQDFIINELINGFVASQNKSFASFKEGPVIDRIVEAFKKSKNLRISDYQLFAMFGNPNKPRKNVEENLKKMVEFLGLEERVKIFKHDLARSEEKIVKFYTFPEEILELLEGQFITQTDKGEAIVNEDFDKNVFVSLFLARFAINRATLDSYKINGICAIFGLILILSFMPKVKLSEDNPVLRDPSFDPGMMSVIPKSWMMKDVIMDLLPPTIQVVAYRLGASKWLEKIETSDAQKRLHLQSRFLIKDVNKWVLGNLCRVEIPIFVEISNIFQEVTVSGDSGMDDD